MYKTEICNSPEVLNSIIELRYDVLRKPWQKPIETVTDELEDSSVNVYIQSHNKVIACGRLQNNGNGVGQIRFMAVDSNYQEKGLGKLIMAKLEIEAKALHLNSIELQARENAVEFYKSCGYTIKEKSFCLWDIIQHYLMTKTIN